MDNFKLKLRKRIWIIGSFTVVSFIASFVLIWNKIRQADSISHAKSFIGGLQIGIFMGIAILGLVFVVKYIKVLNQPVKLRELQIKENDERSLLITSQTTMLTMFIFFITMTIAIVVSGFYNQIVTITLFAVLVFVEITLFTCLALITKKYS